MYTDRSDNRLCWNEAGYDAQIVSDGLDTERTG